MFKLASVLQSRVGLIVLLALMSTMLVAPFASAQFTSILQEGWEKPEGTQFPWLTYGHWWAVTPNPPLTAWDIEFNSIYHHHGNDVEVTSVWCAGSLNSLEAGIDPYPPNTYTHLYWGPFDIEAAAQYDDGEAYGSFWIWADMESNASGNGDFFYFGVRQGGYSPNLGDWDFLYMNDQGGTNENWAQVSFDFDHVIAAPGDTISYIDEGILDNLWISLIFYSDSDPNPEHLGVFIDDIALACDDGLYDFDYRGYELINPDDPDGDPYENLYVGTPVQLAVEWKSYSDLLSEICDHVLYDGNNNVLSTITDQWQGRSLAYSEPFPIIFTPQQEGTLTFTIYLDANDDQLESDELNNFDTFDLTVLGANNPPELEWINPGSGGISYSEDVIDLIYYATNSPVEEDAYLSLYWDYTDDDFTGTLVPGGSNIYVTNTIDTLAWYIGQNTWETEYFVYAKIWDDNNDPVYVRADPILLTSVDEESPTSVPGEFRITSVYPNPFNPTVEVTMALPSPGEVEAVWYSVDGRQVDQQKFGMMSAGSQRFSWTPNNLTSGVYLLRLTTPFGTLTEKVTYLK